MSTEDNLRVGTFRRGRTDSKTGLDRVFDLFPILRQKRAGLTALLVAQTASHVIETGRIAHGGTGAALLDDLAMQDPSAIWPHGAPCAEPPIGLLPYQNTRRPRDWAGCPQAMRNAPHPPRRMAG